MNKLEHFYDKAYDWILTFGPRVILAIIVLIAGLWVIRMFKKRLALFFFRNLDPTIRPFLQSTLTIALQVVLLLLLLQIVGIQMTVFAALIGAFGVAAGLALSGTLQNFASGVLILLLKPYEVGDIIITQGQEGTVTSIQLFYTLVLTFDNKTVIVPNSKLSNEIIINLSREGKRRLDVELKFSYGYEFKKLEEVVMYSIRSVEEIVSLPAYKIGVSALEADGFRMTIQVWVPAHRFQDIKLLFQQKLIDDLKTARFLPAGTDAPLP